jgi:hypothetical protein
LDWAFDWPSREASEFQWRNGIDSPHEQLHRKDPSLVADRQEALAAPLHDYELIAQKLSAVSEAVSRNENRTADLLVRMAEVEKVNARLEEAALITARALGEISGHWDAVYEAMRRKDSSQEASEQ